MISRRSFLLGATALAAVPAAKSMRYMTLEELRAREMEAIIDAELNPLSLEIVEIDVVPASRFVHPLLARASLEYYRRAEEVLLGDGIALKSIAHPWPSP